MMVGLYGCAALPAAGPIAPAAAQPARAGHWWAHNFCGNHPLDWDIIDQILDLIISNDPAVTYYRNEVKIVLKNKHYLLTSPYTAEDFSTTMYETERSRTWGQKLQGNDKTEARVKTQGFAEEVKRSKPKNSQNWADAVESENQNFRNYHCGPGGVLLPKWVQMNETQKQPEVNMALPAYYFATAGGNVLYGYGFPNREVLVIVATPITPEELELMNENINSLLEEYRESDQGAYLMSPPFVSFPILLVQLASSPMMLQLAP